MTDIREQHEAEMASRQGDIEALAEFLCCEFDFDLDPVSGASWPTHEKDDGYRGGGYVRLQPIDVQARARDNARRILLFLDSARLQHIDGICPDAIDNLTHHQRQLDADGTEVAVSRQALCEVLDGLAAARARVKE